VSAGPDPNVNVNLIEETRKQINRLFEEVARLAEADLPPAEFYGEFLKRVLTALAAPAGAVWGRTAQGNLQLQFQINMREVGLDATEEGRQSHDELLRQSVMQPQPRYLPPRSSAGPAPAGGQGAGNPTDYLVLLVPVVVDNQVDGLLEVWQAPDRHPNAIRGFLEFMMRMAELATRYARNHKLRTMVGQQQLWVQLETFARQIHGSLNPIECSYLIANEGRRLIECDRVSIGIRYGRRKVTVDAISGADVVEKRSNLVQLMRKLFEAVLKWGEKLVFTGTKDDTLPPDVYAALDAYLAESNSKLLVVLPLKDERESESKRPARSAMLMECFEPSTAPEQLFARLEVIGRHATPALYNAVEHRRIPFRFLWLPLAKVQEGLGGKAKAITLAIAAGVIALVTAMILVPYPLKMDANGKLVPETRRWLYSPVEAQVREFRIPEDRKVAGDQPVLLMYDNQLGMRITQIQKEIMGSQGTIATLNKQLGTGRLTPSDYARLEGERMKESANVHWKQEELSAATRNLKVVPQHPGEFWLNTPKFPEDTPNRLSRQWTVLNSDYRTDLNDRNVKPSDPLLRLGDKDGNWEMEMKIPQKHVGQVLWALEKNDGKELDVDILVRSEPTRVFKGKLSREKLDYGAVPNKDDMNEQEPIVTAYVRLSGTGIPDDSCLPKLAPYLLVSDTEIHAKVRCGNHAMGYSLLYGVWEFFYEKVVFFF
jgi:hypothetical protein